jgi:hypothetical protein
MEMRLIDLPKGGQLEIEINPGFYDAVRKQFMLQPEQEITDDIIRMFLFGAIRGAIDKTNSADELTAEAQKHKLGY